MNAAALDLPDPLGAFCTHSTAFLAGAAAGPLAGLRFGVKDLFDIAGLRTGFGHPAWLDSHPPATATAEAVLRLLAAGASVVGKTQCDELCYSLNGINKHYGTPANPRAPGCIPGGSSSGSAVAVAGGLVDFSLGSDTGGSVRVPASYCGVLGMRPSFGAVPLAGAVGFAPSYDTAGWFARDPVLLREVGRVLLADRAPAAAPGRLRVASDAFARAEPAAAAALQAALARVAPHCAGTDTVTLAEEGLEAWMQSFRILQGAEIWATHRAWLDSLGPEFSVDIRDRFKWVSTITADAVARAQAHREAIGQRLEGLLGAHQVLALPTTPGTAPRLDTPVPELEAWRNRALGLLCIAGHAGLPQISLPLGDLDGKPLGLSLVAARGQDTMLLDLACRVMAAA